MDFVVSDDQQALAEAVGAACAKQLPLETLQGRAGAPEVLRPSDWQALSEMGVFDLRVPEADGGLGLGLPEAAVVFEVLGRHLVPGPLVATELAHALGLAPGAPVVGSVRLGSGPLLVEHLPALDALVLVDDDQRQLLLADRGELATADAVAAGRSLDPLGPRWLWRSPPPGGAGQPVRVRPLAARRAGVDRGPVCGQRRGHLRPGRGLRRTAAAVRPPHRLLPGRQAPVRRHAGAGGDGPGVGARRGRHRRAAGGR